MDNKKVLVIGHDLGFSTVSASIIERLKDKCIEVITQDSVDNFNEPNPQYSEQHTKELIENFSQIKGYAPELYGNGKQFKCKGKHQYREQGGNWICQCGRKL